jgi:flagellar biogenesis protein FliO
MSGEPGQPQTVSLADQEPNSQRPQWLSSPSEVPPDTSEAGFIQFLLILLVVLAIIALIIWIIQQLSN